MINECDFRDAPVCTPGCPVSHMSRCEHLLSVIKPQVAEMRCVALNWEYAFYSVKNKAFSDVPYKKTPSNNLRNFVLLYNAFESVCRFISIKQFLMLRLWLCLKLGRV